MHTLHLQPHEDHVEMLPIQTLNALARSTTLYAYSGQTLKPRIMSPQVLLPSTPLVCSRLCVARAKPGELIHADGGSVGEVHGSWSAAGGGGFTMF